MHFMKDFRDFDQEKVDIIFSEVFPEEGLGTAIMNRLEKAAGHNWTLGKDHN